MPKYFLVFLLCCGVFSSAAQRTLPEFGKIDIDDLKRSSCSFEPEAASMKLFDIQTIEFRPYTYDTELKTERRVRIKVFNKAGFEHASIKIPYFSKKGVTKIKDLKGVVYNLESDGTVNVQKLEKKDFFKEKSTDNVGIINFTFPNLRPGSVIEYSYVKTEKNMIQIDPWLVQDQIPVGYAATTLITPSRAKVIEKTYGVDSVKPIVQSISGERIQRLYQLEDIASFRNEPFMSSLNDNLLRVMFFMVPRSSFLVGAMSPETVWKFTGNMLLGQEYYGGHITVDIKGTEGLVDSVKKVASISERIRLLFNSVKGRFQQKEEQTMVPRDVIDAWNTKSGSSAEINIILLNLLKKADVEAFPLLVSTRNHGKINMDFPSAGQFNGVDVLAVDSVADRVYILDASSKWQSFRNPPFNVLNRPGLLLNPSKIQWISIDDARPLFRQKVSIAGSICDDGTLEGKAALQLFDFSKANLLDSADRNDENDATFNKKTEGLKVHHERLDVVDDDSLPVSQHIDFAYPLQQTGDFYYINPKFLFAKKGNPFFLDKRNTDIDFGSNQEATFSLTLTIPKTYAVEFMPKSTIVRAPDSSFFYKRIYSADSDSIHLSESFEIKNAIFYKEDYPYVKEFFTRIYGLMAEEIILKKVK